MAHVKKGDEIVVIAGSELGKRGKILEILTKKDRVLVEGVKIVKRHTRKSQNNPQGAIVEREAAIHLSNVVLASKYDAKHGKAEAAKE
jgi:large subunit ribosomal protein L24